MQLADKAEAGALMLRIHSSSPHLLPHISSWLKELLYRDLRCKKHLSIAENGLRGAVDVDQSAAGFDIIHC